MELNYWEKQIILYTKGHFGKIDRATSLTYFAAEHFGLYPSQVEQYSINYMVTNLYEKLIDGGYIGFDLYSFIHEAFKRQHFHAESTDSVKWGDMLNLMLSDIQGISVRGEGFDLNLGAPNKNLLQQQRC